MHGPGLRDGAPRMGRAGDEHGHREDQPGDEEPTAPIVQIPFASRLEHNLIDIP